MQPNPCNISMGRKCMKSLREDSSVGKELSCNAENPGLIPGSGRSPGEGRGYSFQFTWASLAAQTVKNPPAM